MLCIFQHCLDSFYNCLQQCGQWAGALSPAQCPAPGPLLASGRSLPLHTLLLLEDGALLATLQGAPGQWAIWRIRRRLRVGRYLNNFLRRLQVGGHKVQQF